MNTHIEKCCTVDDIALCEIIINCLLENDQINEESFTEI